MKKGALRPRKPPHYKKHPEFNGLEKFVWEGLNLIGRPILTIKSNKEKNILNNSSYKEFKNEPIWHNKTELDKFVADGLNLKLETYGSDKSRNPLYTAIANEISRLRKDGILIDWDRTEKLDRGIGIWRLDKTKLDNFVYTRARREIRNKNFHSEGNLCLIFVRQKQNAFRDELLLQYKKCALCSFGIHEYMIGAHIVPYSVMRYKEAENAMDPKNGLLLCRFCDVAFENGSIRIAANRRISISDILRNNKHPTVKSWLKPICSELEIKKGFKYPPDPRYLKWKDELLKSS